MQALLPRFAIALLFAAVVTLSVFWAMQSLIASGGSVEQTEQATRLVDFVDISKDDDVNTKDRKPKKPPAPPQEPPKPDMPKPSAAKNQRSALNISGVDLSADLQVDPGLSGASGDGDYLPIVKVAPQYPRRAAQRGLEGYVVVEFTVDKTGAVINPVVIESEPGNVFDRAAINAAKKFKYKPKKVNGKAVEVSGVRNIIRFQLDRSGN